MATSFVLSKHFLIRDVIFKNKYLPRLLISSKSFCSKDNESSNPPQKSDENATKAAEKQAKKLSEETQEISEQNAKAPEESKEAAEKTITNLLSEIQIPSDASVKTSSKLDLAKPLKRISKKERLEEMKANESTPEKELDLAVKNVASSFKDAEKVESELSEKLSTLNLTKRATEKDEVIDESKFDNNVNERLISSVEDVAETISESPIPPRTELTEKLLKRSSEKQARPERPRYMYYDDRPGSRYRQRRGGQMSVMAQLRLEAELAAAKKASYNELKKSAQKFYSDESGPRSRSRRNVEMSVIEQMRQEARFGASAKKDFDHEQKEPALKKYKDWQYKDRRDHQSDDMSVISQMRKEAQYAAFDKKDPVEEERPMFRQYRDQREPSRRVYERGERGEMSVLGQMMKEAYYADKDKKDSAGEKTHTSRPQISKIDLFGSTPLNIFNLDSETKIESRNVFWQKLQEKQLRILSQFAPTNGFEEMIMWTEQGKHWKFPIDNETEMGAEEKVGFNEHVFLEQHLKGFPTRGPIRHFMELVTVGLSKNPYITVQRKIDNIEWFRAYFKEKEAVLKETGAVE